MTGRTRTLVGIGVSIVAVAGCVWWALRQPTPRFPSGAANLATLAAAVLVYAVATLARGWRWDHILGYLRISHQRADAYGLVVVGYMGNTVLPARSGEVLRIFLMAERSHARRREVLGSIVTERLLDVAALAVIFVLLAVLHVGAAPGGTLVPVAAGVAVVGAVGAGFAYLHLRRSGRFERFAERVRPVLRASRQLLSLRGLLQGVVTCLVWCLDGAVLLLCAAALDISLGLPDAVFVIVLAGLSALIPAGPGMIGTYDAVALFALKQVGVTGSEAVSCLLLFRFAAFVPITIVGLVLMVVRYGGLRQALRREHAAA